MCKNLIVCFVGWKKLSTKDSEKWKFLRKMVWNLSKNDKFRIVKINKIERMWHV